MPKEFTWGPGGWPKTPRGGGVFATATPQVTRWAYIYERTWALYLARDFFPLVQSSNPCYFNNMNKKYGITAFEGFYTPIYKVDRDPLSLSLSYI